MTKKIFHHQNSSFTLLMIFEYLFVLSIFRNFIFVVKINNFKFEKLKYI
jgi:hypothetical protein